MQGNTIDIMTSDQLSGSWSAIPYNYSDYSVPSADWMTPPSTNQESARQSCESLAQQNTFFQPKTARGIHQISSQASPPIEATEANSTQNSYPYAVPPYHYQQQIGNYGTNQHVQQTYPQKQAQPVRKIPSNSARYVPHGYYTQTGRTLASVATGSPVPQPSLYPSPPVQGLSAEETNYNSKPFGMVYMNGGNHAPTQIGYTGYTEPTLTSLCNGPGSNDLYQPYNVSSMGYGESAPAFPGVGLSTHLDSPFAPLKYDAWNSEPSIMQPLMSPMEHSIAIKTEYIPSAYNSPSPSTITGGSCVKLEIASDTSLSPPPGGISGNPTDLHGPIDVCKSPPSSHLLPLLKDNKTDIQFDNAPVKKPTRKTNNYGDQYACPECRRTFARQCGLTQHTKWHHSGAKPFRCITCGKCFSEQIALDDHMERHTSNDKPYQCQVCPKAFFHKNDLRRHGFQHTGKAPHACQYCSKTFARKDHCHSHEASHERKMERKQRKAKENTTRVVSAANDALQLQLQQI